MNTKTISSVDMFLFSSSFSTRQQPGYQKNKWDLYYLQRAEEKRDRRNKRNKKRLGLESL